jgi:carboxyl-terminal processing protease
MDENHLSHSIDPGALKVTIRKFYRPGGASTQLKGVESDIALPSLSEDSGAGEAELKDPLPWDRVPASAFVREDHVSLVRDELRNRSAARVAEDPDFAALREDISLYKKGLESKSVSLNEADRRQELEKAKAREASRKAARQPAPAPATYEITVKSAELPGLPSPAGRLSEPRESGLDDAGSMTPQNDPVLRESERIMLDYAATQRRLSSLAVVGH